MPRLPLIPGLFALSAAVVGGVLLGRRMAKKAREKAWRSAPGRTPDNPMRVTELDDLDEALGRTRCWCGGTLVALSQGSLTGPDGSLRIAHAECLRCEADHHFYFDVSEVRH